jgi:hypothetical protein
MKKKIAFDLSSFSVVSRNNEESQHRHEQREPSARREGDEQQQTTQPIKLSITIDLMLLAAAPRRLLNRSRLCLYFSILPGLRSFPLSPLNSKPGFKMASTASATAVFDSIQAVIGTDAGNRGMKSLIVPGDLQKAAEILATLPAPSVVVVLSGFPCCVNENPPSETDGPPGTYAIARAVAAFGHRAIVATDACNEAVFAAALKDMALPSDCEPVTLQVFPATFTKADEARFRKLANDCNLLIACERAGPGKSGKCYTMRGIDMNERGLIAPLHRLVRESESPFLAVGDGGNELGMGKVIDNIINNPKIADGDRIGCVIAADHLIAASVSNWGGYALSAAAAVARASQNKASVASWVERCLPTEAEEIALLDRCVAAGCRDGVSGKNEATVDGMPLETSMQALRDIREAALAN